MKKILSTSAVLLLLWFAALPTAAMENKILCLERTLSLYELSGEQFEQRLGLPEGDLSAVTFLQVPENGRLISAGVPVQKGETLLRWELEDLCYLPDTTGDSDWFAIIPHCSEEICAVVNIK